MSDILKPNAEEVRHYGRTEDPIIKAMREENDKLKAEHEALQTALQAVCRYLWNEQHWEFFRAEMLYFSDKERQSASEQNAEKIGEFMRDFISRFPQFEKLVKGEQ